MGPRIKQYLRIRARFFLLVALIIYLIQPIPALAESGTGLLSIGFSSKAFVNVPKGDMKIAVQVLSKRVARKIFGSVESRIYDSPAEIENDLRSKKLDAIALTPDDFFNLRTHVPLEAAAITVVGNSHEIGMLVLVRKDSGLNKVAELKNRSIALPGGTAQYGGIYRTWLETLVMKEGAGSLGDFFSTIKETSTASHAIMPVFFRKIDACVISKHVFDITSELNPQLSRDLKSIAHIDRLAGGIIAFRKDLPDGTKLKTRQALLELHEDTEGRQLLMLFHLNSLAAFRPEYLKNTELLYSEHSRLIGRRR